MSDQALASYYAEIAGRYEEVYAQPERRQDLDLLHKHLIEAAQGHRVLEIACGTGYWTTSLVQSAESVLATDASAEMVGMARAKGLPAEKVRFEVADAFSFQPAENFSACFIGGFWSHIKREEQSAFLARLHKQLGKDVALIMLDENYIEGVSAPVARTDREGNTYHIHTLPDHGQIEIVKNFPTDSALRKKLGIDLKEIRILRLEHYWMATGRFK